MGVSHWWNSKHLPNLSCKCVQEIWWLVFHVCSEGSSLEECGVGVDYVRSTPSSPFWRRSVLGVLWKEWCWSWNSSTLATSCEELTHWKRLWCREGLGAGGEGDDRGWDGWMASPTLGTWVWVNSGSRWWTGRPGVLQFMRWWRVRHDWATELNWTELLPQTSEFPGSSYSWSNSTLVKWKGPLELFVVAGLFSWITLTWLFASSLPT